MKPRIKKAVFAGSSNQRKYLKNKAEKIEKTIVKNLFSFEVINIQRIQS